MYIRFSVADYTRNLEVTCIQFIRRNNFDIHTIAYFRLNYANSLKGTHHSHKKKTYIDFLSVLIISQTIYTFFF